MPQFRMCIPHLRIQEVSQFRLQFGLLGSSSCVVSKRLISTSLPFFFTSSSTSSTTRAAPSSSRYDAIIIGAGHNGLVAAAYLAKAGKKVCVLEKRAILGGAALTEEVIPGFKFSRASYVLALFRQHIVDDLQLYKCGLTLLPRNPYSYTPLLEPPSGAHDPSVRSLLLDSHDQEHNAREIARFSTHDAQLYSKYMEWLGRLSRAVEPLIDSPPIHAPSLFAGSLRQRLHQWHAIKPLLRTVRTAGSKLPELFELLTSPASKILNRWFDSEILKAVLGSDAVIGEYASPDTPGTGYVMLHHTMGGLRGPGGEGAWYYVRGGMGAVCAAIATSAKNFGAEILADQEVCELLCDKGQRAVRGVRTRAGLEILAPVILANCTPHILYRTLYPKEVQLSEVVARAFDNIDYTSPVTKINVAVKCLPSFAANPSSKPGAVMPQHHGTIHLNCESLEMLERSYLDARYHQRWSSRPIIEISLPTVQDNSLSPPGSHIVQLFTQYTPYTLKPQGVPSTAKSSFNQSHANVKPANSANSSRSGPAGGWSDEDVKAYTDCVFDWVERYAPGFRASVIGYDVLTPDRLERVIGLTGGSIFHGSMRLDQLYFNRPLSLFNEYTLPVEFGGLRGLFLCGAGAHPGGGVMGAPGHLASQQALLTM